MNIKSYLFPCLVLLFISIFLSSCGQAPEIQVSCDTADLIDAINSANANTDTTILILEQDCIYTITSVDNTDGGAGPNGLPQISTKIKIEGNNATLTKQQVMGNRFFFITDSGNLVIEDLTLEKGYAFAGSFSESRGGAVYIDGGAFRAVRSIFRDNQAPQGHGGAVYNLGIFILEESLLEINGANNGGSVYIGGDQSSIVNLDDVTFENNMALDNGGAIYNANQEADIVITGSTFFSNSSYEFHGGAIYMEAGEIRIYNSAFSENLAGSSEGGDGGAIYNQAGSISLYTSNFNNDKAFGVGGMLYAGPGSTVRLNEIHNEDSKACHGGGGLYVEGETEILDSTLTNNQTGGSTGWTLDIALNDGCSNSHGGAIYNTGTLTIDSSLLEHSWARQGDGDGVYNLGALTIINSTFHQNLSYNNAEMGQEGVNNQGSAELSYSTLMYSGLVNSGNMTVKDIVVAATINGCINSGNLTDVGESFAVDAACPFSNILPSFGDLVIQTNLSDNGGPTLTHFVGNVSPVIDKSNCLSISGAQVLNDQRGVSRPYPLSGSHVCDAGAFEVHSTSPPPPPPAEPSVDEPSDCDPFADEEIRVVMLPVDPDTLVFPVYLRFLETVPGINSDGTLPYRATLGSFESYLTNQQGFENRAYFLFIITEDTAGAALDLEIFKDGCENQVLTQPNLLVPAIEPTPDEDQPEITCSEDLEKDACEAAGGTWFTGVDDPYCLCP